VVNPEPPFVRTNKLLLIRLHPRHHVDPVLERTCAPRPEDSATKVKPPEGRLSGVVAGLL
jgi:hypothetical protein